MRDQTTGLELLMLPRGIEYLSMGWTKDPLVDGTPTPSAHDGMAAFRMPDGMVHLVRNHEQSQDEGAFMSSNYDPGAMGGTTTVVFDPDRDLPRPHHRRRDLSLRPEQRGSER